MRFPLIVNLVFGFLLYLISTFAVYAATTDINVSAIVEPKSTDAYFNLSTSVSNNQPLDEGGVITVKLDYRLLLAVSSWPFKIETYWDKGFIEEGNNTYVDALEYVIGSASASSDKTLPVIDLKKNKIIWDIKNLPPSMTDSSVTYQLRVRSNLPTFKLLTSRIHAYATIYKARLPDQERLITIQKKIALPLLSKLSIDIIELTNNSITFLIKSFLDSGVTLYCGYNQDQLNNKFQDILLGKSHLIEIPHLNPQTQYYCRVDIQFEQKLASSEIITFTTSSTGEEISIKPQDIIITSDNIPINLLQSSDSSFNRTVVFPKNYRFSVSIKTNQVENINQITAKFIDANVLGVSSYDDFYPTIQETRLIETAPRFFTGGLTTPLVNGDYNIQLEINDTRGGFFSKLIPYDLLVSNPIKVLDKFSHKPVEKASLKISIFDSNIKQYIPFEFILNRSLLSDAKGEIFLYLPSNLYLLTVSSDRYKTLQLPFEPGINNKTYPTIYLERSNSLYDTLIYYKNIVQDGFEQLVPNTANFFNSQRTNDLIIILVVVILTFSSLVLFATLAKIGLLGFILLIFESLHYWYLKIDHKDLGCKTICVYEQNNYHKKLPGVKIYIIDTNNRLRTTLKTNLIGEASLPINLLQDANFPIKIMCYRKKYLSYLTTIDKQAFDFPVIDLFMIKDISVDSLVNFIDWVWNIFLISNSFMITLLISFMTIMFILFQGVKESLSLITLWSMNMFLWYLYIKYIWIMENK